MVDSRIMLATKKPATYDALLSIEEGARFEVLGGEVVAMPAALPRHARPQRTLGRFVGGPFDDDDGFGGPGGWWIFSEVDVRFTEHDIVRPDLVGWRRERLVQPDVRPIDVVPDWVCEILSPSTASRDRVYKRHLYAQSTGCVTIGSSIPRRGRLRRWNYRVNTGWMWGPSTTRPPLGWCRSRRLSC